MRFTGNESFPGFDSGKVSFDQAVKNTERLIEGAREAGVEKIVHISVSNPSRESPYPYFRGKAVLENLVEQSGIPYAIIRPTLVFGGKEEILVNNITWLLRRFPVFAIPVGEDCWLQPIHVVEVADLVVNAVDKINNKIVDAAGPDILTFEGMVRLVAEKTKSRSIIFRLNPGLTFFLLKIVGILTNDVVLTQDELGALRDNLLVSKEPPTGEIHLAEWLDQNADRLGRKYASEMKRHYW